MASVHIIAIGVIRVLCRYRREIHVPGAMKLAALLILAVAIIATACGSGDEDPTPTPVPSSGGSDPLTVEELIGTTLTGDNIRIMGFLVIDSTRARLCSALFESFPPQCGGASVEIAGFEELGIDIEEAQGVRWTNNGVIFRGRWSNGLFTALGTG
jgi:hypothetical protein